MTLEEKLQKYASILKSSAIYVFEYDRRQDCLRIFDEKLDLVLEKRHYVKLLESNSQIHSQDLEKARDFFLKGGKKTLEIRRADSSGDTWKMFRWTQAEEFWNTAKQENGWNGSNEEQTVLWGTVRDVTKMKEREWFLEKQANRDSMTMLYNPHYGKAQINEYLLKKTPYASCGLMVVDIDYFKNVNDTYGHSFGDQVLKGLARLLERIFDPKDICMRAGGDEFVVLLKDINHPTLVKKAMQTIKEIRNLKFSEENYVITCSMGVCYLPENVSGYTYDQLFKDADWALYRAKENGRNRYVFCDNLRRFEEGRELVPGEDAGIDARYMRNDIVSTAFEIFEKMNSFGAAMELLLKVVGIRLRLDRITVLRTDIKDKNVGRQFQWCSRNTPEVLKQQGSFTKEDFLILFHSYDDYGTTVLHYDEMNQYSPQARALLMQGEAKTVVYAAMYCEGKYVGAISYVVCGHKRFWSRENRQLLGELTKIISAHIAKNNALNMVSSDIARAVEFDSLTGLLSFARFREEAEHLIVGGYARSHVLLYSDFENFKCLNEKYGYTEGDQLLREFANYVISTLENETGVYFTRVISDQFILFMPYEGKTDIEKWVHDRNEEFISWQKRLYPDLKLRIRTGIYCVTADCGGVSAAIDAANFARRQVSETGGLSAKVYDNKLPGPHGG